MSRQEGIASWERADLERRGGESPSAQAHPPRASDVLASEKGNKTKIANRLRVAGLRGRAGFEGRGKREEWFDNPPRKPKEGDNENGLRDLHGRQGMKPQSVSMNADSGEKTWLTPRYIIDALGPFDLDPCCPDGGMPWQTARQMIAKSEDGLKADWEGKRVWLNPPYGREALPFFEKMIAKNTGGGIALVFARTDTALWQDYIFPNADAVLFLRGRLRFCHQDGSMGETATAPSALVAFSRSDAAILSVVSDVNGSNELPGYLVLTR